MLHLLLLGWSLLGPAPALRAAVAPSGYRETVEPNDNRRPAGTRSGNLLTVTLEVRTGMWYPEGPSGRGLEVAAWAEPGKPLQTPGPLIRAASGTVVRGPIKECNLIAIPQGRR